MQLRAVQRIPASAGLEAIYAAYEKDGGVIIKGLYDLETVAKVNQELDPFVACQKAGHPDPLMNTVFGSENRRIPAVTASQTYRDVVIESDLVHALAERALVSDEMDGYWLSVAQVIQVGPGSEAQALHRDQLSWTWWEPLSRLGLEACVNFMVALSPFTDVNGATRVIPGTHILPDFDVTGNPPTIPAEMDRGDAFFFRAELSMGAAQT